MYSLISLFGHSHRLLCPSVWARTAVSRDIGDSVWSRTMDWSAAYLVILHDSGLTKIGLWIPVTAAATPRTVICRLTRTHDSCGFSPCYQLNLLNHQRSVWVPAAHVSGMVIFKNMLSGCWIHCEAFFLLVSFLIRFAACASASTTKRKTEKKQKRPKLLSKLPWISSSCFPLWARLVVRDTPCCGAADSSSS